VEKLEKKILKIKFIIKEQRNFFKKQQNDIEKLKKINS
jgi:hypothetical protein